MTTKTKPANRVAELRQIIREAEAQIRGCESELRQIEAAAIDRPVYASPDELAAFRMRHALVERLYAQRASLAEAEAIADLVLDEGLSEAEACRRYDANEEETDDE